MPWALSMVLAMKSRTTPGPHPPAGPPVLGARHLEKTVGLPPAWKWCTRGWGHRILGMICKVFPRAQRREIICRGDDKGGRGRKSRKVVFLTLPGGLVSSGQCCLQAPQQADTWEVPGEAGQPEAWTKAPPQQVEQGKGGEESRQELDSLMLACDRG